MSDKGDVLHKPAIEEKVHVLRDSEVWNKAIEAAVAECEKEVANATHRVKTHGATEMEIKVAKWCSKHVKALLVVPS